MVGEEEGGAHDLKLSRFGQGMLVAEAMMCVMLLVVKGHASLMMLLSLQQNLSAVAPFYCYQQGEVDLDGIKKH